jgi:hypothetical protein
MKAKHMMAVFSGVLICVLAASTAQAQTPTKMKMTTDIPAGIAIPGTIETRLGTLRFFNGFPDDATVENSTTISTSSALCRRTYWDHRHQAGLLVFEHDRSPYSVWRSSCKSVRQRANTQTLSSANELNRSLDASCQIRRRLSYTFFSTTHFSQSLATLQKSVSNR